MKLKRIGFIGIVLAIFLVNSAIIFGIPAHPDEYSAYHSFACWQPAQKLNIYHASCSNIQMEFGPIHYSQSYLYVGVTSSLLMAGFSQYIDPISAHFVMGFISLLIAAIGMKLSFGLTRRWYLFLVIFPIVFSIVRDGSPARITVIVFAFIPYLYRSMRTSSAIRRVAIWVLLNLMILIAIEDKPFIVYLAPGMFLIILAQSFGENLARDLRWFVSNVLWFISLFSASLVFLIGAKQNGEMYLLTLAKSNESRVGLFLLFSLATSILHMFSWYAFAVRFVDINYDPTREQPEFYEALPWGSGALSSLSLMVLAITALIMLYFFLFWSRASFLQALTQKRLDEKFFLFVATLLLFFVPVLGGAWTSHHFVFAQMMVAVLLIKFSPPPSYVRWDVVFVVASILTASSITMFPHRSYNSEDSRAVISRAIQEAGSSDIINCAYSCYFEYSLRNIKNIPITFAVSGSELQNVVNLYSPNNRIFHICKDCSTGKSFDELSIRAQLVLQEGEWSLFKLADKSKG